MDFIMLRYIPSIRTLLRTFIINKFWILSKAFLCLLRLHDFIFQFVNMVYHMYWFADIETSLHSWLSPARSWCIILLMPLWVWFANIFLRIMKLCASLILGWIFPLLCCLFLVLVSGLCWPQRISLEAFLPFQFLRIVWEK